MQTILDDSLVEAILKPCVVVETRERVPEITEYLQNTLDQIRPFTYIIDDVFDAKQTFEVLDQYLPNSPDPSQKNHFMHDIVRLCTLFARSKVSTKMKIQIEIVKTNKCRIFHEDFYRRRLLCTYMGPGTEWLDHSNVNRSALGKGCNSNIVKDFTKINRAKEFEVVLLKGAKCGQGEISVVHRSPPIEKEKLTRVLLKIDE